MRNETSIHRTAAATAVFMAFIVLFTLMMDALAGKPSNLVGPLVSGSIGALVFAALFHQLSGRIGRRVDTNGG